MKLKICLLSKLTLGPGTGILHRLRLVNLLDRGWLRLLLNVEFVLGEVLDLELPLLLALIVNQVMSLRELSLY